MGFILVHEVNTLYMNRLNEGDKNFGEGKYPEAYNCYGGAYDIAKQYDDQNKMNECLERMEKCERRMNKTDDLTK